MALVRIEYYGMDGEGKNVTEAKRDAGRKIERALSGSYSPEIVTWRTETALVYREPDGWVYSIIRSDDRIRAGAVHGCREGTKDEAIRRARYSIAQNGWEPSDGTEAPDFVTDARDRSELATWYTFQLRCIRAKAAGITNNQEIHDYGCGCFTYGEELRRRVEGEQPAAVA